MSQLHDTQPHNTWCFDPDLQREDYVRRLLQRFCLTPTTAGRVRPADRRLALRLYHRGVSLDLVEAAFTLAASRRLFRHPDAEPLSPVQSLHYFLPVIEEIRSAAVDPDYIRFLRWKLDRADQILARLRRG